MELNGEEEYDLLIGVSLPCSVCMYNLIYEKDSADIIFFLCDGFCC